MDSIRRTFSLDFLSSPERLTSAKIAGEITLNSINKNALLIDLEIFRIKYSIFKFSYLDFIADKLVRTQKLKIRRSSLSFINLPCWFKPQPLGRMERPAVSEAKLLYWARIRKGSIPLPDLWPYSNGMFPYTQSSSF
jgi:hypothetical protein